MKTIKPHTPRCADDPQKRAEIGSLLQKLVYAGLEQKGDVERWWARCEQDHRNEWAEDSAPGTGLSPMHVPFTQPRVDMLTAQVCGVLTKQEPFMIAEGIGPDVQEDKLERTVQKFWKVAGFTQAMRRASHICVDTNRVWYRVAWELNPLKPFAGVLMDVIHPRNVCLFPATLAGIEGARMLGHRFYRRQRDVMAMQQSGAYFDDRPPTYGDTPQEYDVSGEIASAGAAPGATGPDPGDMLVELWDVLLKYAPYADDDEKWYRATFAFKQSLLLSFEPYPYSRPWYFDSHYITGNEEAYWSAISVSRHLSGLQDATDKMTAMVYNGSAMTAFPAVWGPELPQKDARYGYGEYIPTDAPLQNWSPSVSFKGEGLMQCIEGFDLIGDKTARISANTQGGVLAREMSATENAAIASGVAVGLEEYIANFSEPLPEMAGFTCELLGRHFHEWEGLYAAILQVNQADLMVPTLWEPNGSSPGSTPGAKLAAVQKLVSMLQAFGPLTGLDPYTLTQVAIANMGFSGTENLQIDKEQLIARQRQAGPIGAAGLPTSGFLPPSGMAPSAQLPPGSAGVAPAAMLPAGPAG